MNHATPLDWICADWNGAEIAFVFDPSSVSAPLHWIVTAFADPSAFLMLYTRPWFAAAAGNVTLNAAVVASHSIVKSPDVAVYAAVLDTIPNCTPVNRPVLGVDDPIGPGAESLVLDVDLSPMTILCLRWLCALARRDIHRRRTGRGNDSEIVRRAHREEGDRVDEQREVRSNRRLWGRPITQKGHIGPGVLNNDFLEIGPDCHPEIR